jgi:hypothetical protein
MLDSGMTGRRCIGAYLVVAKPLVRRPVAVLDRPRTRDLR